MHKWLCLLQRYSMSQRPKSFVLGQSVAHWESFKFGSPRICWVECSEPNYYWIYLIAKNNWKLQVNGFLVLILIRTNDIYTLLYCDLLFELAQFQKSWFLGWIFCFWIEARYLGHVRIRAALLGILGSGMNIKTGISFVHFVPRIACFLHRAAKGFTNAMHQW